MARYRRYKRGHNGNDVFLFLAALVVIGVLAYVFISKAESILIASTAISFFVIAGFYIGHPIVKFLSKKSYEHIRKVRKDWREIKEIEKTRRFYTVHQLVQLDPIVFERHMAQVYRALGYTVEITPPQKDKGIDLILHKHGITCAVQVKRYTRNNVGAPEIQAFYGAYARRYDKGLFVTTSDFTQEARLYAKENEVMLTNGTDLGELEKEAFDNKSSTSRILH